MNHNSATVDSASLTQSPVNISTTDTPTQSFNSVLTPHYQSAPIDIFNNGKNIDSDFATKQNYLTYQGEQYYLEGFHFHTNSEHTFNGQNADGEIHLVHQSSTGKVLVVGILLDGVDPNGPNGNVIDPQLSSFFGKLDTPLQDTSTVIDGGNFDPSKLISSDSQVYNYGGSLTTTPFSDATWIVAADTLKVDANDLQNFRDLQKDFYYPQTKIVDSEGFNNREIQNELFLGTDGDNFLQGDRNGPNGFSDDLIYARRGNDTVISGLGNDKIFGEIGKDMLFGSQGDDLIVGDLIVVETESSGTNLATSAKDYLIGGEGRDQLYIVGGDIAVGGGPNSYNEDFIEFLDDEPFDPDQKAEFNLSDGQQDTFVFVNDGNGYTTTIVGFEAGIDILDLRQYNLGSVDQSQPFQSMQAKSDGLWWEYKTPNVNGNEVVFRIDAAPDEVNAALA